MAHDDETPVPHFLRVPTLESAAQRLGFVPQLPDDTLGRALLALDVHLRDHKRVLPSGDRTLEARFDGFVFSLRRHPGDGLARDRAIATRYGPGATSVSIGGCEGRAYELGPDPAPGDPDGRSPAVVSWSDGAMHCFLASGELGVDALLRIARSVGPFVRQFPC